MGELWTTHQVDALTCVSKNDLYSLRIICRLEKNRAQTLEKTDYYGNTALLKACYLGKYEAALILIQSGANIKAVNHYGQNALSLATYSGNLNIIYELLRYCSYEEFNRNTLIPSICVATMCQNWPIYEFLKQLDPKHYKDIHTTHGLNCEDIMAFMQMSQPICRIKQ